MLWRDFLDNEYLKNFPFICFFLFFKIMSPIKTNIFKLKIFSTETFNNWWIELKTVLWLIVEN